MTNGGNSGRKGGIGFLGALTLAFIVLKLCGVIAWPWMWVLSPIWITAGLVTVVLLFGAALVVLLDFLERRDKQRRRPGSAKPHQHGPRKRWGPRRAAPRNVAHEPLQQVPDAADPPGAEHT